MWGEFRVVPSAGQCVLIQLAYILFSKTCTWPLVASQHGTALIKYAGGYICKRIMRAKPKRYGTHLNTASKIPQSECGVGDDHDMTQKWGGVYGWR